MLCTVTVSWRASAEHENKQQSSTSHWCTRQISSEIFLMSGQTSFQKQINAKRLLAWSYFYCLRRRGGCCKNLEIFRPSKSTWSALDLTGEGFLVEGPERLFFWISDSATQISFWGFETYVKLSELFLGPAQRLCSELFCTSQEKQTHVEIPRFIFAFKRTFVLCRKWHDRFQYKF